MKQQFSYTFQKILHKSHIRSPLQKFWAVDSLEAPGASNMGGGLVVLEYFNSTLLNTRLLLSLLFSDNGSWSQQDAVKSSYVDNILMDIAVKTFL